MKIIELFSGMGAQHKALSKIGIEAEYIQCDIDKVAVKSYNAIHGETKNLGDISKVNEEEIKNLGDIELITYSFPCQAISGAGLQEGLKKGSGTTSSLLWEVEKFIKILKPKYLLMENVKQLVGEKFMSDFNEWNNLLDKYGYYNFWQVLNAKDYGIPQNRERVFVVSIRKDLKQGYKFPEKEELKIKVKDLLEENVNEKYFLSEKMLKYLTNENTKNYNRKEVFENGLKRTNELGIASTITTKAGQRPTDNFIGFYDFSSSKNRMEGKSRFNNRTEYVDTLLTAPKKALVYKEYSNFYITPRGSDGKLINGSYNRIWKVEKQIGTLNLTKPIEIGEKAEDNSLKIRKLTPLECFRLMGFGDSDYEKVKALGTTDNQMYKLCGNSIVVNVLEKIFYNLFINKRKYDKLF